MDAPAPTPTTAPAAGVAAPAAADDATRARDELIRRAAQLRAEGAGWPAVADALGRDTDDLVQLCRDAGPDFDRLVDDAFDAVVKEGTREAVYVLRKVMRGKDDNAAKQAAAILGRFDAARERNKIARERNAIARERNAIAREKLQLQYIPKQKIISDGASFYFAETPAGRAAHTDMIYGKLKREEEEKRTPEEVAYQCERIMRREMERRGYLMPDEWIPYWCREGYIDNTGTSNFVLQVLKHALHIDALPPELRPPDWDKWPDRPPPPRPRRRQRQAK